MLLSVHIAASDKRDVSQCPMVKIEAERLPDLNVPRSSHALLYVNGEVVVIGGHTDGFVPTPTAEYFADGKWHLMQMPYTADISLCQILSSGKVLIAGGIEDNLGIGQQFSVQAYDPVNHSFTGFGCLDTKRAFASGVEIDSGQVVISGNWYRDDAISLYDGRDKFQTVKPAKQGRCFPYILRSARDNAIILAWHDNYGKPLDSIWVDRFRGEPFRVPLLDEWRLRWSDCSDHRMENFLIGDTAAGDYTYLITVQNKAGEIAFMKIHGEEFSLVPTQSPIPIKGIEGDSIYYLDCVVVDRNRECAYMHGIDDAHRIYVLKAHPLPLTSAAGEAAQVTLYYTDPLSSPVYCNPTLTDDGNLVFAGGALIAGERGHHTNNFKLNNAAYILHLGDPAMTAKTDHFWLWLLLAGIFLVAAAFIFFIRKKKTLPNEDYPSENNTTETTLTSPTLSPSHTEEAEGESFLPVLCQFMEEQKPYLRNDLKIQEVATALSVPRATVSTAIRSGRDCSFNTFVNTYRIAYAKQLMREQPNAKISSLYLAVGFANETSFFRAFKEITGQTPSEWKASEA